MRISFLFRVIFSFFMIFATTYSISKSISSSLKGKAMIIAKEKSKNIVTSLIMDSLDNITFEEELFIESEEGYSYDIIKINELIKTLNRNLLDSISGMNEKYGNYAKNGSNSIVFFLPLSLVYDNIFLSYLGPNIPIKLTLFGDVISSCTYQVEEFGVNNALISLFLSINVNVLTYLPSQSTIEEVSYQTPLAMNVVSLEVPSSLIGTYEVSRIIQEI